MKNRQPYSSACVVIKDETGDRARQLAAAGRETMRQIWSDLTKLYDRHPRWGATLAGTALLLGLTAIHASMGFTSALRALYVLPIWLATRMGGRISGFALVVFCTAAGIATDWQLSPATNESVIANVLIRFVAFVI